MPRYGDLDALEKKLFPMGMVDDGRYALPAKSVKVAIDRLPKADVVPRTVIAEIFEEIGEYASEFAAGYLDDNHFLKALYDLRERFTAGGKTE
jgi:hypothetical protein